MVLVALLEEQEIQNTRVHVYKILLNFFCHEWRPLDFLQTPKMLVATSINNDHKQQSVKLNGRIFNLILLTKV